LLEITFDQHNNDRPSHFPHQANAEPAAERTARRFGFKGRKRPTLLSHRFLEHPANEKRIVQQRQQRTHVSDKSEIALKVFNRRTTKQHGDNLERSYLFSVRRVINDQPSERGRVRCWKEYKKEENEKHNVL